MLVPFGSKRRSKTASDGASPARHWSGLAGNSGSDPRTYTASPVSLVSSGERKARLMSLHVVVTTFNPAPGLLERAARSALACAGVAGVTIVDDGSAVPVEAPVRDDRVEVVRQVNAGPASARNAGLDRVRADWAVMLDDDDELVPEGVAGAIALADRLGAVGALVGRVECLSDGSTRSREAPAEWAGGTLPRPADAFRPIQLFNASGTLVSGRALATGIRYDTSLWVVEDREFIRRLADVGPIAVAPGFAVRAGTRPGGERLTSARNLERRAIGHLAIMGRWLDGESEAHFREATLWLLGAMSKAGMGRGEVYQRIMGVASERGWIGPLRRIKLGARTLFRRASA